MAQISSGACLVVSFASMMKSSSFYMMGGGRIDKEIPCVFSLAHDIYSIASPVFMSVRNQPLFQWPGSGVTSPPLT